MNPPVRHRHYEVGDQTTHLVSGLGAVGAAAAALGEWLGDRTVFLVSSRPVLDLHGSSLDPLTATARRAVVLEVPDGEGAKSVTTAESLWRQMVQNGGKRDSRVVSFGGGTVGDLAGFVAGTFLRGVQWAQIPTTAVAQVDAALGGKCAVNLREAKNCIGVFHHPSYVVSDPTYLETLPRRHRQAGLVEAIKTAALFSPRLLEQVEERLDELLDGSPPAWHDVGTRCQDLKMEVVVRDAEESGDRRLLNLGHTLGHAVESLSQGGEPLLHGEAVAFGMAFAAQLSETRGLPSEASQRLGALLGRLDLPPWPQVPTEELLARIRRDKKAREEGVQWVLLERLGKAYCQIVDDVEVADALGDFGGTTPTGSTP